MAEWEVFFFLSVGLIDGHEVVCVLFCFAFFLQKIKDDKMKKMKERERKRDRGIGFA